MSTARRAILITGATGGIGSATAILLAQRGPYDIALHYNSASEETREVLRTKIKEAAPDITPERKIEFFQADLGDFDSVRKLYKDVTAAFGVVSILFNNAGATGGITRVQNLADVPIETFEKTWRINTASTILLTQLCLPAMEEQGWGRIIFDSSIAAFTGGGVGPHYASSKSALHGFVHWLASNVAKKGVTVNAVAPALIADTNMIGQLDKEAAASMAARIPAGRMGRPEEIAETVLWMVNTPYLTNKVITVDGGVYPY